MINFNLRDKRTNGRTLIIVVFTYQRNRLRLSTGVSCLVKDWNFNKQRISERFDIKNFKEKNKRLDQIENLISRSILDSLPSSKKMSFLEIKEKFRHLLLETDPDQNKLCIWNYFDQFIAYKKQRVKEISDYHHALRKHLNWLQTKLNRRLTLNDFTRNSEALKIFDHYLRYEAINIKGMEGLSLNTIGKQYKNLKVFLNWCFDEQIHSVFSLKHLQTERYDIDSVYLKESELLALESLELSLKHALCRDLFLLGCETGLRFGDFSDLSKESIHHNCIEVMPKKTRNTTGKKIVIPLSSRALRILFAYGNTPPKWPRNKLNEFNSLIRDCCKMAQIDENQLIFRHTSGSLQQFQLQKWELVSSHTCRRTFCTLKFLSGMPTMAIMKFSGHSSEKNFLKYLKLDAELNAEKFREFFH